MANRPDLLNREWWDESNGRQEELPAHHRGQPDKLTDIIEGLRVFSPRSGPPSTRFGALIRRLERYRDEVTVNPPTSHRRFVWGPHPAFILRGEGMAVWGQIPFNQVGWWLDHGRIVRVEEDTGDTDYVRITEGRPQIVRERAWHPWKFHFDEERSYYIFHAER